MATQTKKYTISFPTAMRKGFFQRARRNIVKTGKASRSLSKEVDRIVYGS